MSGHVEGLLLPDGVSQPAVQQPRAEADQSLGGLRKGASAKGNSLLSPSTKPPGMESGLNGFDTFKSPGPTFPNACHVSEVEIDPETGVVTVLRYLAVDDVGTVMNPLLLKGQLHGGIVQGIAQILGERIVMDESGQVLTGSFMDYHMPRADEYPSFEIESHIVPSPRNPLGIKGAGEAGTVGAVACLASASHDALAPLGISSIDFPATPERIWQAVKAA